MPRQRVVKVFDLQGNVVEKVTLPPAFATPIRPDVIKRAVLSIQSSRLQPQGRDLLAGKKTSAESRGTGLGISRVPRVKGGGGRAAFAPGTVKGRQAHPPKSAKRIVKKLPKKEKKLALLSAIAATASKETVKARGHVVDDVPQIPLVVTENIEALTKTKDVEEAFVRLGLFSDVCRVKESRKVRAGKGKMRGRRTKQGVGPLLVVAEDRGVAAAAKNIPGVDVATVGSLNAELLSPGSHPGRLTLWSTRALDHLRKAFNSDGEA
jgi:large subunit ribosomal protein L4e